MSMQASSINPSDSARFRVRTVTVFATLTPSDFSADTSKIKNTIQKCAHVLETVEKELVESGYEVQTLRIATNPFGEWLANGSLDESTSKLNLLASLLKEFNIQFCSLGPAQTLEEIELCPKIVAAAPYFSCSANVAPTDVASATATARCILAISKLEEPSFLAGGLGNFRFCAAASCKPFIPFFPAAKSCSMHETDTPIVGFALGLENGALTKALLEKSKSISNIGTVFCNGMTDVIMPLQTICERMAKKVDVPYLGVDSSLNPSLDAGGSVAEAMETLDEIQVNFGGQGTLAAAAAITTSLQTLPGILLTGYCGLMLPICEDTRLARLEELTISHILSISSVCGVGIDTLPVPGSCEESSLMALILDVAGLAGRWNKSLSCRVFPIPGLEAGDMTAFDSPYLCNCKVFPI